uniref:Uncharacterized protein n=1 Tax=Periophthalmus magnuspinnatus TaxID=409849 RepID=A0A3B4AGD3_9GOBI
MDAAVNYCVGLLSLLLLQGALHVEGRSILNSGNGYFNTNEDINAQNKILALLLHKSIASAEKKDHLAILANKFAELEEVRCVGIITSHLYNNLVFVFSFSACFWKYCV